MCETARSVSASLCACACVCVYVCVCVCVVPGVGCQAQRARRRLASEAGWQQPLPQASAPRLSSYISRQRGPRSRGSSNEMEQQKDGEIRLPALPQQIKRWD